YQEDLHTEKPARSRVAEKMRQYQAELLAKIEAAQAQLGAEQASKPDVLLDVAGLRPKAVDKRYQDLAHAKEVNASQAQTLNKTAGAHRGAEVRSDAPRPAEAPAGAPAAKRDDPS